MSYTDMDDIDELRIRWESAQVQNLSKALGKGRPCSPYGKTSTGHDDFRGFELSVFFKSVEITKVDFSYSKKARFGQFVFSTVKDCLFDAVDFPSNLGSLFCHCSFRKASLKGAVLRGKFDHCDFSNANLTGSIGSEVTFIGCDFSRASLRKASLTHCRFENCSFEGTKFGSGSVSGSEFVNGFPEHKTLGNTLVDGALGLSGS